LTPEEARAYLATPVSPAEYDGVLELVRWFRRRYTTGAERLAYVRRAYRRWSEVSGAPASGGEPDSERG
jgi:hypothetical protein